MEIGNTGLDIEREIREQNIETDWIFGALSQPCLASIPELQRERYLPLGRIQRGKDDYQSCASIGPVNILETKFNYLIDKGLISKENIKWLKDKGYITEYGVIFSDRFVAINAKTTRQGNSMIAPLQAIHKQGLIPESLLPTRNDMTWDEYHNPLDITTEMFELGLEFLERFLINYERVDKSQFKEAQEDDLINLGGWAWGFPNKDGIYERREGAIPNHVFVGVRPDIFIYDSYVDTHDSDYIKHLASDYEFLPYAYRLIINEGKKKEERGEKMIEIIPMSYYIKRFFQFIINIFK